MEKNVTRRTFMVQAGTAGAVLAGAAAEASQAGATLKKAKEDMDNSKKILVAADPYAVSLKNAIVAHLKEKGFDVTDLGSATGKDIPYYDGAVAVCKALQEGAAPRAILFCGTGMGMSIVANHFKGVTASVVESVFAAKMCRAINNANVLCLGQMIWGADMAKAAVDAFLNTPFTEGFEGISGFLHDACAKVEATRT